MKKDSRSSLEDISSFFDNKPSRSETPGETARNSKSSIATPYPLYQQKIRALLKPPDYQRNPPKFMSAREPRSEFERKEAAIQVKLLKKTFNTMHQRFNSVDKELSILRSEARKINALKVVGENDLGSLQKQIDELQEEEDQMLSKIKDEFNNNLIYRHIRERMRQTLMYLEVKNQYLSDQIKLRDFLIESEHRKKIKTLENKYTKAQAYKNLKKTVKLDYKDRSADLDLLEEDIQTREKIHELRQKRIKKYEEIAETAANEERDLKNNNKREAVLINSFWGNFLSFKLRFYQKKYEVIEKAFERIKENTVCSNINDVVSKFLSKERDFNELMGVLTHDKDKCLKMIKKNDMIEGKIDDLLLSHKSDLDENIINMKENISLQLIKGNKIREKLVKIKLVRDNIRTWIVKQLGKLGIRVAGREKMIEIFNLLKKEILKRLNASGHNRKTMFITEL